jgi:hypothetical protein
MYSRTYAKIEERMPVGAAFLSEISFFSMGWNDGGPAGKILAQYLPVKNWAKGL